jgi:drug/metabolite transporter (DMT)-like permease
VLAALSAVPLLGEALTPVGLLGLACVTLGLLIGLRAAATASPGSRVQAR